MKFTTIPDTGYCFFPPPSAKLKPGQWKSLRLSPEEIEKYEKTARPMSEAERKKLDAEWEKLLNTKLGDLPDVRIVGSGKRGRQKRHIHPDLHRQFAKIETGLDLLNFVKKYGRLTNEKEGDDVEELLDQAKEMRRSIAWADKHKRHPGGTVFNLGAMVSLNLRTGRITRTVFPQTLLQALWLQFIYTPVGAGELLKCKYCDEEFWAGAGTRRRADAKFCSHAHQVLFNSLKRSNPQLEKRK